jgi:hypothetical protein
MYMIAALLLTFQAFLMLGAANGKNGLVKARI